MNDENRMIVGCIDGSPLSDTVADYSAWIAARIQRPLTFLNTVEHRHKEATTDASGSIGFGARDELLENLSNEDHNTSKQRIAKGKAALQRAQGRAAALGATASTLQRHGHLYENLTDLADQMRVLVIGLRGEDSERAEVRVGTQVEEIIRSLFLPTLLVMGEFAPPKRIMLAYDGSKCSEKALQKVSHSPLFKTVPCHVVTVTSDPQQGRKLLVHAEKLLTENGIEVTTALLEGDALHTLLEYEKTHNIDMMVMGAFSKGRLRSTLFGSFTALMIEQSNKPLLLLR
ncbi:universal stress protein [Chrysiogenes arsenatis]|uniref:universal stress protein n=1 Tax=Chrysiogenes arsenatis TaxID=309797 RepID=UPI000406E5CB|nr:universal stress protein [Chrysiogenes arsenatis]